MPAKTSRKYDPKIGKWVESTVPDAGTPIGDLGFDYQAFNKWLAKKYPKYAGLAKPPDYNEKLPKFKAEFLAETQKPVVPTLSATPAPAPTPTPTPTPLPTPTPDPNAVSSVDPDLLMRLLSQFPSSNYNV